MNRVPPALDPATAASLAARRDRERAARHTARGPDCRQRARHGAFEDVEVAHRARHTGYTPQSGTHLAPIDRTAVARADWRSGRETLGSTVRARGKGSGGTRGARTYYQDS